MAESTCKCGKDTESLWTSQPTRVFILWILPKYLFMLRCCVEWVGLLLNLADGVVWYVFPVHKRVKKVTEFEVKCSLDKWLGELCQVILAPNIRCLLAGTKWNTKDIIYKSLIRANVNRIVYENSLLISIIFFWSWYGWVVVDNL